MPPAVEQVPAEDTVPLRQRVLRPHQSVEELLDGLDRAAVAFAIRGERSAVVCTATVGPQAPPWPAGPSGRGWRLRAMATAPDRRREGLGAAVLAAVIGYVSEHGGGVLWCNARVPAEQFYRRAGFTPVGEPWAEPHIGPHVTMWRPVPPAVPGRRA